MIMDTVERLPLYEELLPYAKELSERFRTRHAEGLPFEVRFKEYETKPDEKRKFEVHRHTIDLMMCFEGEEIIHICPLSFLHYTLIYLNLQYINGIILLTFFCPLFCLRYSKRSSIPLIPSFLYSCSQLHTLTSYPSCSQVALALSNAFLT